MESSTKALLEKAYKKPLSEVEFEAISSNLSGFFDILTEWKNKKMKGHNNEQFS